MAKYTITPWRQHVDLLLIRQQLYHLTQDSPDSRRHAVNRVMAWKLRGNLPHAIESTALLIDAILHHRNGPSNSPFSIRAVYTAAFTRFVTGFCDIGRNKERSLEPSSMLDIAKQIGMPVEFVALRHEATHEEMPWIGRLVKVTEGALRWLWEVYWSKLPEVDEGEGSILELKAELRRVLKEFRAAHREALRAKQRNAAEEVVSRTSETCLELCGKNATKMTALAEVLVQDKLLSPSKRELGASLDGAFLIWDPLLKDIARKQKRFVTVLTKSILEAISASSTTPETEDADKEALCKWLSHIQSDAKWEASRSESEQHDLEADVILWSTLHANHWTSWLGQRMLEDCPQFPEPWEEIFQASRLDRDEAVQAQTASRGASPEAPSASREASHTEQFPWRREVLPVSSPIGIAG